LFSVAAFAAEAVEVFVAFEMQMGIDDAQEPFLLWHLNSKKGADGF
jgi:hypothetical protein